MSQYICNVRQGPDNLWRSLFFLVHNENLQNLIKLWWPLYWYLYNLQTSNECELWLTTKNKESKVYISDKLLSHVLLIHSNKSLLENVILWSNNLEKQPFTRLRREYSRRLKIICKIEEWRDGRTQMSWPDNINGQTGITSTESLPSSNILENTCHIDGQVKRNLTQYKEKNI